MHMIPPPVILTFSLISGGLPIDFVLRHSDNFESLPIQIYLYMRARLRTFRKGVPESYWNQYQSRRQRTDY